MDCGAPRWLARSHHSKKVLGLTLSQGSFCVEFVQSLCELWLPPKDMDGVRLTGDS